MKASFSKTFLKFDKLEISL